MIEKIGIPDAQRDPNQPENSLTGSPTPEKKSLISKLALKVIASVFGLLGVIEKPDKSKKTVPTTTLPAHVLAGRVLETSLAIAAILLVLVAGIVFGKAVMADSVVTTLNLSPQTTGETLGLIGGQPHVIVTATGDAGLTVNVHKMGGENIFLKIFSSAGTVLWLLGLAGIAIMFSKILKNIANGNPFGKHQARRFYMVGALVLVASGVADLLNFFFSKMFVEHFHLPETVFVATAYHGFIPPFLALVAFILGYAFELGYKIQEDTEGLV